MQRNFNVMISSFPFLYARDINSIMQISSADWENEGLDHRPVKQTVCAPILISLI